MSQETSPPSILLVEDSPADVQLMRRCLKEENQEFRLQVLNSGEGMMDQLREDRPDLILLDLNLPVVNGRTLLKQIKQQDKLRSIPVVILTSSNNKEDIRYAYSHGANSYMVKPDSSRGYRELSRSLIDYWLKQSELPFR